MKKITLITVTILGLSFALNHFLPNKKPLQNNLAMAMVKLPLSFIENQGQLDKPVRFYMIGKDHSIFFTPHEIVYNFSDSVIKQKFVGSNSSVKMKGLKKAKGKVNYFVGKDKKNWKQNISTYEEIVYENLYPGIDLVFSGLKGEMKSEYRVATGVDYKKIVIAYIGINEMKVSDTGDLVIKNNQQELRELKPSVYQKIDGLKIEVEGKYIIQRDQFHFEITSYDPRHDLIIDPELIYSTYLGGGSIDYGKGIAVDTIGNIYVAGCTFASNFPTASPFQGSIGDDTSRSDRYGDAFIAKFNPSGSALIFSTYLGGLNADCANDMTIDAEGNIYIGGSTQSPDFPMVSPWQASIGGGFTEYAYNDAFIAKLNPSGSALIFSTYLGGRYHDYGSAIAIDTAGNTYVTGITQSTDFPTASPLQSSRRGSQDIFIAKFDASGSNLTYSTYLGGSYQETANAIAVDTSGNAYVAGKTNSTDFPTLYPFQALIGDAPASTSTGDAFIAKFNPSGSSLIYSTYLGGSRYDSAHSIAVGATGNIYVAGETASSNFPTASPWQASYGGSDGFLSGDAFIAKLNPSGSALIFSTYLGGDEYDRALSIVTDTAGNAYVTGSTSSTNFPTASPFQADYAGGDGGGTAGGLAMGDAFIAKFNASGSSLFYSSYLGGSNIDIGTSIVVDTAGNAYVTGYTRSTDFPTVSPLQATNGGYEDAFIAKIHEPSADLRLHQGVATSRRVRIPFSLNFTVINDGPAGATEVVLIDNLPSGWNYSSYTAGSAGPVTCSYIYAGRRVRCVFSGTIESERRRSVTINIVASRSGTFQNRAEISSATEDPDATNNTVVQRISVSR